MRNYGLSQELRLAAMERADGRIFRRKRGRWNWWLIAGLFFCAVVWAFIISLVALS